MGRPRKEDQEHDLHPFEQLAKAIDLDHHYTYRFLSKETCHLSSSFATEIRDKLLAKRPAERSGLCTLMMNSHNNFAAVIDHLFGYQLAASGSVLDLRPNIAPVATITAPSPVP